MQPITINDIANLMGKMADEPPRHDVPQIYMSKAKYELVMMFIGAGLDPDESVIAAGAVLHYRKQVDDMVNRIKGNSEC